MRFIQYLKYPSIQESINKIKSSVSQEIEPKSFIQAYCKEIINRKSELKFFNDDQLLALCVDFFQAGSETTSNTLGFGMLYMLKYPEVMIKVQNELDNVVGWNNLPKLSDRGKLKYTEAVICEIQRISNVAPLGNIQLRHFLMISNLNEFQELRIEP